MVDTKDLSEFLDRLVDDANKPIDGLLSFSHTFLKTDIEDLLPDVVEEIVERKFHVFCNLNHRTWIEPFHEFYLASSGDGVYLWQFCIDTGLMNALSKRLSSDVHWISVDEDVRVWSYQRYSDGALVREELDPEVTLRADFIDGRALRGSGPRKFLSTSDFLNQISNDYRPNDMIWRFGKWKDEVWRKEMFEEPENLIEGAARLMVSEKAVQLDTVGKLNSLVLSRCQKRLFI